MGLDTSHNAWHGPYSSFNSFRYWLAERIGIDLNEYVGYNNPKATLELTSIAHELQPLFNHSDCDGELSSEECKQVVDGLDKIINSVARTDKNKYFIEKALQFRNGCMDAYAKNESIDFH